MSTRSGRNDVSNNKKELFALSTSSKRPVQMAISLQMCQRTSLMSRGVGGSVDGGRKGSTAVGVAGRGWQWWGARTGRRDGLSWPTCQRRGQYVSLISLHWGRGRATPRPAEPHHDPPCHLNQEPQIFIPDVEKRAWKGERRAATLVRLWLYCLPAP